MMFSLQTLFWYTKTHLMLVFVIYHHANDIPLKTNVSGIVEFCIDFISDVFPRISLEEENQAQKRLYVQWLNVLLGNFTAQNCDDVRPSGSLVALPACGSLAVSPLRLLVRPGKQTVPHVTTLNSRLIWQALSCQFTVLPNVVAV